MKNHWIATVSTIIALLASGCDVDRGADLCELDEASMHEAVNSIVSSGQACQKDSDCVALDVSNGCYGACPVAVSATEITRLEDEIWEADFAFCTAFKEQCGYETPGCPALRPVCEQGQCRMAL